MLNGWLRGLDGIGAECPAMSHVELITASGCLRRQVKFLVDCCLATVYSLAMKIIRPRPDAAVKEAEDNCNARGKRQPKPKKGDLRVWWIPQIPGKPFYARVFSPYEAKLLLKVLAGYDMFKSAQHIKPDYSNAGGLQVFEVFDADGWTEWEDEATGEQIDDYEPPHH